MNSAKKKSRIPLVLSILFFVAVLIALWQRQYIHDELKLRNYEPSAQIAQLVVDSSMTDKAKRLFYINHPAQKNRTNFSEFCRNGTEQTVVLGCYKGVQQGIYLLQISNEELKGIEQVTAAHEMLHAAYDRHSSNERRRIDALLQSYFDNDLQDEGIRSTIEGYKLTEPDDLVNEMHSILGTQESGLTAELEDYYDQYFDDRDAIVQYYKTYEQAFSSRQQQIRQYDQRLEGQKQSIEQLENTVNDESDQLIAKRARLNAMQNGSAADYNAGVDDYNRSVNSYNAKVRSLKSQIESYNTLIAARNAIAFQEQELIESISAPDATTR